MYLVPLISKRWEQLGHCHGTDDRLRVELESLLDPRDRTLAGDVRRTKAFDQVNDLVFHQQSTYPSTYITVPYLVHNLEQFNHRMQHSIIDMVVEVSKQGPPPGELREAELAAYAQSLIDLEGKTEKRLRVDAQMPNWSNTWNALNLLGQLATLRGLKTVGHHLRRGEEETRFCCQHCGEELVSRGAATKNSMEADPSIEDGLPTYSDEFEREYVLPLSRTVTALNDDELTADVYPRQRFVGDGPAAKVHQWSLEHGHPGIAAWLRNFYGFCHCPICGRKHDLAETLTQPSS